MITLMYDADLERAAMYEDGLEDGLEKGIEKGIKITAALTKGQTPEEIANILQIPIEAVLKYKDILG